jgi:GNAT superfamily N-acetyltransferase
VGSHPTATAIYQLAISLGLLVAPERRSRGLGRQLRAEAIQRCRLSRMTLITDTAEGFSETLPHRRYAGFRLYPTSPL